MKTLATALLALALFAAPAFGASCGASTSGVALGRYTPNQASPADSAGSITVTCAEGALDTLPMTVAYSLDIGRGGSSSYSPREMTNGGYALRYNLYRDALRSSIWGDSSGGTANVSGTLQLQSPPAVVSATHNVYARIFAGQNATPGSYADLIVITVAY